jgi:hypothetical protein
MLHVIDTKLFENLPQLLLKLGKGIMVRSASYSEFPRQPGNGSLSTGNNPVFKPSFEGSRREDERSLGEPVDQLVMITALRKA